MSLVEVRPIEKPKWHGKKGKDSFKRPWGLEALVDPNTGKYSTGLSEEDRKRLEAKTGYNLSDDYMPGQPHEFWSSKAAQVKLKNQTNVFNTANPLEEIKVKIMKASKYVANSMKEYEEGLYPEALYVIHDESEEIELKAAKSALKTKAIIEVNALSPSRKAEVIQILKKESVRNQSQDYLDVILNEELIPENPKAVLRVINADKTRTSVHAMVLEAIHKNVLRKDGTAVYYMDDQIGFDLEAAIDYFLDPTNQRFKVEILEKIN